MKRKIELLNELMKLLCHTSSFKKEKYQVTLPTFFIVGEFKSHFSIART